MKLLAVIGITIIFPTQHSIREHIEIIHIVNDSTVSIVTNRYAYDYMSLREVRRMFGIEIKVK